MKAQNWQVAPHKTKEILYSYENNQLGGEETQLNIWPRINTPNT